MVHRTHELRVLPDTVMQYETYGSRTFIDNIIDEDDDEPMSNRQMFFEKSIEPPDPVAEADNLPDELIKRLQGK